MCFFHTYFRLFLPPCPTTAEKSPNRLETCSTRKRYPSRLAPWSLVYCTHCTAYIAFTAKNIYRSFLPPTARKWSKWRPRAACWCPPIVCWCRARPGWSSRRDWPSVGWLWTQDHVGVHRCANTFNYCIEFVYLFRHTAEWAGIHVVYATWYVYNRTHITYDV